MVKIFKILTEKEFQSLFYETAQNENNNDNESSNSISENGNLSVLKTKERNWKGSALDLKDGFIHLSNQKQASLVANTYFTQEPNVYVLEFEEDQVHQNGNILKWESPAHLKKSSIDQYTEIDDSNTLQIDELFPHLYGNLDLTLAKITQVQQVDGRFHLRK